LPPPVGEPRRSFAGSLATPKSKPASALSAPRLPLVVQIIDTFSSRKSRGVEPQATTPDGCILWIRARSSQYCSASTAPRRLDWVCVPTAFMSVVPLAVARPWNSQYGNPDDGICTPQRVVSPPGSRRVSRWARPCISCQLAGGFSGSRPDSRKCALFQ
jgi:hypothetical protein